MIRTVAAPWMPNDRVWLNGAPVRIKKAELGEARIEGDSIVIPVSYEVEYEPVKQAIIRIDPPTT